MIEYCYPECTTACVTALSVFKKKYPNYRADDVEYVPPTPSIPSPLVSKF